MGCESSDVVGFDLGPLLQGQMRVAKSKVLSTCLLLKNAVYHLNYVSWPFMVDTSCIWSQMCPWSSLRVEEPVYTSWSSFCTVNHLALASNCPGRDLNRQP